MLASFGAAGETADARLVELKATLTALDTTLAGANSALKAVEEASNSFDTLIDGEGVALVDDARKALAKADVSLDAIGAVVANDLPGAMAEVREAIGTANRVIGTVGSDVTGFTATLTPLSQDAGTVLKTATAALDDARGTLARLDTTLSGADATLEAIETASGSVGTLIDGEGTALVSEARATLARADVSIAAIGKVVSEDVPGIVADIRSASDTANRVIGAVGGDLEDFTGRLTPLSEEADAALKAATQAFHDASTTLTGLDTAMDSAERMLGAAEVTFTSANRIIDEEVAPTAESIRVAAKDLGKAVSDVAADLPAVTAELRATLARASDVVERLDGVVAASAPGIENFAATGLPEFVRFTKEARDLVASSRAHRRATGTRPGRVPARRSAAGFQKVRPRMILYPRRRALAALALLPLVPGCAAISSLDSASKSLDTFELLPLPPVAGAGGTAATAAGSSWRCRPLPGRWCRTGSWSSPTRCRSPICRTRAG